MTISRRTALLGVGSAVTVAALAPIARSGVIDHGLSLIRRHFGETIAASDAAREFMVAYHALTPDRMNNRLGGVEGEPSALAHVAAEVVDVYADYGLAGVGLAEGIDTALEESVIRSFLMSTNAYIAHRDGVELIYSGFYNAYDLPCGNQLTANFAA